MAGTIYYSHDGGATWVNSAGFNYFLSLASSADGNKMVAGANYQTHLGGRSGLYTSTNAGTSWNLITDQVQPSCVASSADGSTMFAADYFILRSSDSGATWAEIGTAGAWRAVACSADSTKVVAAAYGAGLFTSEDSGISWSNSAPAALWQALASSADGHRLFAVIDGGGIYTLQTTAAPYLGIAHSGSNLVLSWIVPSTEFRLQESADLTNWFGVGVHSALNYTNLHHEVTLPLPAGPRFYRLATP